MFLKSICLFFLIFFVISLSVPKLVFTNMKVDPIQEINKSFPDSTEVKTNRERSIEFCPDNTCDLFVATKEVSIETLKDFTYLYIYFYSDYYILDEWRGREEPALVARQILSKPRYQFCKNNHEEDKVRCLLRNLSQKKQIKLFSVRYDENKRNLEQLDLNEAIKVNRLKNRQ